MDYCQKIPICPLSITAYTSKQAKMRKDLQEKEETRKKADRARWQSRVNLGMAFSRWRKLREEKGLKTDMELAILLMDSYERGRSTSGPRKKHCKRPSPPPPLSIIGQESLCNSDSDFSMGGVPELENRNNAEDMAVQELENSMDWSDVTWYSKSREDDESRSLEERTEDQDCCPPLHVQSGGASRSPTRIDDLEGVDETIHNVPGNGDADEEHRPSACKEEFPHEQQHSELELSSNLGQEDPESPLKKEEEEELPISQVGELVNRLEEAGTKDPIPPMLSGNTMASLHGQDQSQSPCHNQHVENREGHRPASTSIQEHRPSACKEEFPHEQQHSGLECSPSLGQEDPEPPLKKEEEEELPISQVGDRLEEEDTKDYICFMLSENTMASLHGQDQSQSPCHNQRVENGEGLPPASTSIQDALQPSACKEEFPNVPLHSELEPSSSLGQEDPDPPLKKEEEEVLPISQVGDRLEEEDTKDCILSLLMLSGNTVASLNEQDQSQSLCHNQRVGNREGHRPASTSIQRMKSEPASPHQHLCTDCSTEETEDSDGGWDESGTSQSGLSALESKIPTVNRGSSPLHKEDGKLTKSRKIKPSGPFCCILCGHSFQYMYCLVKHAEIHLMHTVVCGVCGTDLESVENLRLHFKTHQEESMKTFRCSFCPKSFLTGYRLKAHLTVHAGEKPYSCKICGKAFNLCCKLCGRSFQSMYNLVTHAKVHQMHTVVCGVCGNDLESLARLRLHYKTHQEETMKRFPCSLCPRSFPTECRLKGHLTTHTGEKPFSCEICGKAYGQKGSLKSHMLKHTGEKPFKCEICHKAFSQKSYMKFHMKGHAEKKPDSYVNGVEFTYVVI